MEDQERLQAEEVQELTGAREEAESAELSDEVLV